jgi:nucleotide-binding universal stress UspA family protein
MRKVEKILVPIDFSEESARALKYALSLAKETRAEVVALHVVEKINDRDFFMSVVAVLEGSPFAVNEFPAIPVDVLLQERSLDLWNFIGRIVEAASQVKITKRLRMGCLVKEIAAITRKDSIDLIVLELRKRFLFPNLATLSLLRIIRKLDCPVLIGSPITKDRGEPGRPLALIQPRPEETIA